MKRIPLLLTSLAVFSTAGVMAQNNGSACQEGPIHHVLLISIDGMHALDFKNCSNGIAGVNDGKPYCPNLAALSATGVNYVAANTSKPSDRKSTRLNSSHLGISYAVFCL